MDPISLAGSLLQNHQALQRTALQGVERPQRMEPGVAPGGLAASAPGGGISFQKMVGNLIEQVDGKAKIAQESSRSLMLGESDNLHQTMINMQESGVAFTLLVEVRNKLVEAYQELMRMQV